jgi:hypothetical protein
MSRLRRRQFLAAVGSVGLAGLPGWAEQPRPSTAGGNAFVANREDDALLDDLERRSFRYF